MGGDQCLGDGQTQTKTAASFLYGAALALGKSGEQFGQKIGLDPRSGVGHFDDDISSRIFRADTDRAALGSELLGVVEQVPEDLLNARWIGPDAMLRCAELHFQLDAPVAAADVDGALDQLMNV